VCLYSWSRLLTGRPERGDQPCQTGSQRAREIYNDRIEQVKISLNITALGLGFRSAVSKQDLNDVAIRLKRVAQYAELDFAGLVNEKCHRL